MQDGWNVDRVQTWQAARILDPVRPTLGYLSRLEARMRKLNFQRDDPLYSRVLAAQQALDDLFDETHYLSIPSGAGRPPRE